MVISHERIDSFVIVLPPAVCSVVQHSLAWRPLCLTAAADGFQNREATVFIKNDELANKLGTRFLEECDATQRSGSSHVEVTCWGSF